MALSFFPLYSNELATIVAARHGYCDTKRIPIDIALPDLAKAKRNKRILPDTATLPVLLGITLGTTRLKPAARTERHRTQPRQNPVFSQSSR